MVPLEMLTNMNNNVMVGYERVISVRIGEVIISKLNDLEGKNVYKVDILLAT